MLESCVKEGDLKQACGIALESRRLDIIEGIINQERNNKEILSYLADIARTVVSSGRFRREVLCLIIKKFKERELVGKEYSLLSQCFFLIEDSASIANLLFDMINKEENVYFLLFYF